MKVDGLSNQFCLKYIKQVAFIQMVISFRDGLKHKFYCTSIRSINEDDCKSITLYVHWRRMDDIEVVEILYDCGPENKHELYITYNTSFFITLHQTDV
jgi:hypothetical protein